jgi:hypothetical protein
LFRGVSKPAGEKLDIESQVTGARISAFFLFGEQVEQQGAKSCFLECVRNELVARTVAAASAAVREEHEAAGVVWDNEFSVEYHVIGRDENFSGAPSHDANIGSVVFRATGKFAKRSLVSDFALCIRSAAPT